MRKVALILSLVLAVLVLAKPVRAADEQVCTQVYGGGVVCGAKHEVVNTSFNIHPAILGGAFLGVSRVFSFLSRKLKKDTSSQS